MQQAALLELQVGDILVVAVQDGKAREDGVAVVAVVVNHVAAIGGGCPDVFGQEFVLRRVGPVVVVLGMAEVQALHFLQKDDVRVEVAQALAQLMHHHPPVELRESPCGC
jgi:hypothetical protein